MVGKIKQFLFHNTSTRQTVAKNTFWMTVAHVGGRLLRAIIIIYAARVLGADAWGAYNYAITLVAFLTLFVDLGISNILTRETAKTQDEDKRAKMLATSFVLKLVLIGLGVLVVLFVAPLLTKIEGAKVLFPIVAWILVFDAIREFGFAYLRAREKMEWEAALSIIMNILIVGLGFLFLSIHTTVVYFTYAYAIGTGLGMLGTVIALRHSFRNIRRDFTPSMVKTIATAAWPFAISGILGMLTLNTDVVVIGWLLNATELGYYSAAMRLIQLFYLIPTIISISVLPTFARTAVVDNAKFRQIFERIVSMMFLVAMPIVVGGIIVAKPLISFVFGSSYEPGALSFQLLLFTILIDFPAVVLSAAIFAYDKQKNLIAYAAIGGFLNIILDLILVPYIGIAGSALTTVIAQFASNMYLWMMLKKINYFTIFPHLKKVIASVMVMGVVTFALLTAGLHVMGVIILSIPVYFSLLYLLREKLLLEVRSTLRPAVSDGPTIGEGDALEIQEETHRRIESH